MIAGSDGGPMAVDRDYHHAIRDAVHEFGTEDNSDMPEEGNEGFASVNDGKYDIC